MLLKFIKHILFGSPRNLPGVIPSNGSLVDLQDIDFNDFRDGDIQSRDKIAFSVIQNIPELANSGVQLTSVIIGSKSLIVTFSDASQMLLKNGAAQISKSASGVMTSTLRDHGGKIIEHARVDTVAKAIDLTAKTAAMVTSACHVISSYDNAQRLKNMEKKLDILIEGRSNDQIAELYEFFLTLKSNSGLSKNELIRLRSLQLKMLLDLKLLVESAGRPGQFAATMKKTINKDWLDDDYDKRFHDVYEKLRNVFLAIRLDQLAESLKNENNAVSSPEIQKLIDIVDKRVSSIKAEVALKKGNSLEASQNILKIMTAQSENPESYEMSGTAKKAS